MENRNLDKSNESQNAGATVNKARRSFAKAGVIAPVIMSLTSKTALGATPYLCTLSGQLSGNQSSTRVTGSCPTGTPGASLSLSNAHLSQNIRSGGGGLGFNPSSAYSSYLTVGDVLKGNTSKSLPALSKPDDLYCAIVDYFQTTAFLLEYNLNSADIIKVYNYYQSGTSVTLSNGTVLGGKITQAVAGSFLVAMCAG